MTKFRLLRPIVVIVLISGISQVPTEANESSRRSRSYLSSFIDHWVELPNPSLSSVLGEPNESSINEEALFATHSFSDAGITYNVELYYRELDSRIRIRALVGDRELRGLFNRFYQPYPNRQMWIFVTREDSSPEMSFSFGYLSLKESSVNTDAVYDAIEAFARQAFPQVDNSRISVDRPPGLLKKTCIALLDNIYLVNEEGQADPFTLENLRVAYNREGIKVENLSDLERIGRSLIQAEEGEKNEPSNYETVNYDTVLISDVNEIPGYSRRPLDPVDERKITGPRSFSKGQTNYWSCYTYKRIGGIVSQYTFGFAGGQLSVADKLILGQRIGSAVFQGPSATVRRQGSTPRSMNSSSRKKRDGETLSKAPAVTRMTLLEAVKAGSVDQVGKFISSGAYVNSRQKFGYTALHYAAWGGHKDIAELLLAKGADVNAATWLGDTPLHSAAERNRHDIAALLISVGGNVNAKGSFGRTPLQHAARLGNRKIAQLLLANGAEVNDRDDGHDSPLYGAAQGGHADVAALLISSGADLGSKYRGGLTPLYRAAEEGHKDVVNLLIASGADINVMSKRGEAPLHVAAEQGHAEVVELLIEKGANVNAMGDATRYANPAPLHRAARYGRLSVAQLLIAKGADVNASDDHGETPLFQAVFWGSKEVAELLIAKGADVNLKQNISKPPLHKAVECGDMEMVRLLVENGADVNAKNTQGKTPIDLARDRKHQEVVEFLLSK